MDDDGYAVHYSEVARGTPVISADGEEVGTIARVLGIDREAILDGIVVRSPDGRRFVDAPEVARTAERAVTLTIPGAEFRALPLERTGIGAMLRRVLGGR